MLNMGALDDIQSLSNGAVDKYSLNRCIRCNHKYL